MLGAFAAPYIGWRGMVAVGLLPAFLCLYIRALVPESPHWLLRQGRVEEARRALAWALQMDPAKIALPAVPPVIEQTRWLEIFKYPRSIIAGCLTGLTQTGGVALALWLVTLLVMVLRISAPEASELIIWISLSAIAGRFFCSWISDAWGRRASGVVSCVAGGVFMSLAGYLHSVFIGGMSMFFLMILIQNFFGSGNYSIVGPYMGELWPARLRGSGMGFVYGVGNLGKFIGPAGLALIAGSSNMVSPKATLAALVPGVQLLRLLVLARRGRVLVHRHGDERQDDRRNRNRTRWPTAGCGRRRGSRRRELSRSAPSGLRSAATGEPGAEAASDRDQRFWVQSSRHRKSGPSRSRLGQPIWAITRSISVRKMSTAFLTPGPPPATAP